MQQCTGVVSEAIAAAVGPRRRTERVIVCLTLFKRERTQRTLTLDIVVQVNNAGQLQGGALWELTDAQIDLLLDVNLRACMLLVKDVMPHMRARGEGHIVTVSSIAAIAATHKTSVYAASKAGVSRK